MADDTNKPLPQSSIPPRAVPPRPVAGAEGAPSPAQAAARLKPAATGTAPLTPTSLPPVTPSAPAGSEAAAAAIKRMTARIVMMANDVEPAKKRTGQLPPGGATAHIQPATSIPMPNLSESPKTIRIQPISSGTAKIGTQPISGGDSATGKTKAQTSRIPLASAMAVPQSGGSTAGGAPRTIKLKRPGEMSTIRMNIPSAGSAAAAPAGQVAAEGESITQKKTIRVKRAATPTEDAGEENAMGVGISQAAAPVAVERGMGWVVALAAVCLLLAVALTGLLASQISNLRFQ